MNRNVNLEDSNKINILIAVDQVVSSFNNYFVLIIAIFYLKYAAIPEANIFSSITFLVLAIVRNTTGALHISKKHSAKNYFTSEIKIGFTILFFVILLIAAKFFVGNDFFMRSSFMCSGIALNGIVESIRIVFLSKRRVFICFCLDLLQALLLFGFFFIYLRNSSFTLIEVVIAWGAITSFISIWFFLGYIKLGSPDGETLINTNLKWFSSGFSSAIITFCTTAVVTTICVRASMSAQLGIYITISTFFIPIGFLSNFISNLALTRKTDKDLDSIFKNSNYYAFTIQIICIAAFFILKRPQINSEQFYFIIVLCFLANSFSFQHFKIGLMLYSESHFRMKFVLNFLWGTSVVTAVLCATKFKSGNSIPIAMMIAEFATFQAYRFQYNRLKCRKHSLRGI